MVSSGGYYGALQAEPVPMCHPSGTPRRRESSSRPSPAKVVFRVRPMDSVGQQRLEALERRMKGLETDALQARMDRSGPRLIRVAKEMDQIVIDLTVVEAELWLDNARSDAARVKAAAAYQLGNRLNEESK